MPTRYQQLRKAIANPAAPADEQAAYLGASERYSDSRDTAGTRRRLAATRLGSG